MPRPNGLAAAEMERRIKEVGKRERSRRAGYDPTVKTRRVKPQPRKTKREREAELKIPDYPGWVPREKECRRDGCTNVFLPPAPAAAYCSIECKEEATRGQRRITDKGKRARRKAREAAARGGKPPTRQCALEGCDVEFVPAHPRSSYCSPEHSRLATRESKRRSANKARKPARDVTEAEIAELERKLAGAELDDAQREYVVLLWKRVNTEPDCPGHVYDRLERLLGVSDAQPGSTITPADAT